RLARFALGFQYLSSPLESGPSLCNNCTMPECIAATNWSRSPVIMNGFNLLTNILGPQVWGVRLNKISSFFLQLLLVVPWLLLFVKHKQCERLIELNSHHSGG